MEAVDLQWSASENQNKQQNNDTKYWDSFNT